MRGHRARSPRAKSCAADTTHAAETVQAAAGLTGLVNSPACALPPSGGPGGAVLHIACTLITGAGNFTNNTASTFAGAIAGSGRRTADSNATNTPVLFVKNTTFALNRAASGDGGAIRTVDLNTTVFTSQFSCNTAAGSGGAVVRRRTAAVP